ncbi:MAG: hypothetical protein HN576_14350 [Bacteriovoracaceae bacterium]|nr:hypothetical protein [Bacteriovoracaceae bacterium]
MPIDHNTEIDGTLSPGDMTLVRNQNTAMEMMFEVGYGRRIKLLNGKAGSLVYTPSVALGVTTGRNISILRGAGELEHYTDKFKIQGFGGSITNRLEYNLPKERFGIFYENRLSYFHQKHGFADGTQEYDLKLMGNTVGIKFMIYNPKNH